MLVTITGAYKNAGDHLIGLRARALLEKYVDEEIINIDRKAEIDYQLINSASAVLLTGGPALQPNLYPDVYNLDLSKITVPVVGFGLGWKAGLGKTIEEFGFTEQSKQFLEKLSSAPFSVRDGNSFQLMQASGIENPVMTGCPAWYDLEKINDDYQPSGEIRRIVISTPAVPNKQIRELARLVGLRYPKAEKTLLFQAGLQSTHSKKSAEYSSQFRKLRFRLRLAGWRSVSTESDVAKMMNVLDLADLHIGYRVHSHLYSLSQRKPSVLIAEDARGESQNTTLGLKNLTTSSSVGEIEKHLDEVLKDEAVIAGAIKVMRERFAVMQGFLESLKTL